MNPPATSQTRLKPAEAVSACTLAETMIEAKKIKGAYLMRRMRSVFRGRMIRWWMLPILCLTLLFGCGEDDSRGGIVFAVGGAPSELAAWEKVVRAFEDQNDIQVSLLRQPANSQQQLQGLMVAMKSEQKNPDVFLMDVAWVGLFSAAGWLEPLDTLDRSVFFSELLNMTDVYEGKLMAAPVYLDGGILYYRTDLVEKAGLSGPPKTWRELAESGKRIQEMMREEDPGFFGYVWQGAQYEGLIVNFLELAGESGGFKLKHEAGGVRVDLAANVAALRFMRDLIWKYEISLPSTYTEMQEEEVRTFFQSGSAMYERNWPYAWSLQPWPETFPPKRP
jgi:multiple sugar transport system substrate-binding protein